MFAEISSRYYHIHLINQGTIECAEPHGDLIDSFMKIRPYPKYLSLERLATQLASKNWVYSSKRVNRHDVKTVNMIGNRESISPGDKLANFQDIELQVFDINFDSKTYYISPKKLRAITVPKARP